ncbi:hypothetical protein [Denitratisoma oestradiolicum]|nr:hypothetical protein [Denitratisoma oestradiolicum]
MLTISTTFQYARENIHPGGDNHGRVNAATVGVNTNCITLTETMD